MPYRITGPLGNIRYQTPSVGGSGEVEATVTITVTAGNTATLGVTLWHANGADRGGAGAIIHTGDYSGDPAFAADGYRGDFETTKTPMHDAQGNIIGVLGIAHGITVRKALELELRDKDAQFRLAIESSPDGFWVTGLDGRIIAVNDAYCRISGSSISGRPPRVPHHVREQLLEHQIHVERLARIEPAGIVEPPHEGDEGGKRRDSPGEPPHQHGGQP